MPAVNGQLKPADAGRLGYRLTGSNPYAAVGWFALGGQVVLASLSSGLILEVVG